MKRRSFLFGTAASIFGEQVANAAFGIFQTALPVASTFNPVIVATEQHVFGMDPSDPTQYLVPGNGAPAVSTSAFYNSAGLYNFRSYSLDDFGAIGAAAKAANGGRPYVFICSADHPVFGYAWRGGTAFKIGYSFQPWDFPRKMSEIIYFENSWDDASHPSAGGGYRTYEFPTLFYNPDDPDGLPIYLFAEAGAGNAPNVTSLWRSADFVNFTIKGVSHWPGQFSSFVRYAKRNGLNDFTTIGLSRPNAVTTGAINAIWSSTDGFNYSSSYTALAGYEGGANDPTGSSYGIGLIFQVGSQLYAVGNERTAAGAYTTIFPITSSFEKTSSLKNRISSLFSATGIPGPTWLQESPGYYEDGILYAESVYGFPGDVNTTAGSQGRGGAPYSLGGGLDHQFINKVVVRCDDAAARQAAPVGMSVSAAGGVATVGWKDALPQNTYRLYYGTNATTQATLVGDYSGVTSATFSPGTGRFWCRLVTLDSGVERKARVLSVYVSSSVAFVNEHIDRMADDGGDISSVNRAALDRFNAMLDSVGIRNILELFSHAAFGTSATGAPGGFLKVYDLGTTRLPRSEDFKATTSGTTYSATGVNGGPCWTNANNNSYGYWGNPKLGNTIQQKRQITIIVAYERTQTTEDITFVGTGPIWGNTNTGAAIIALKHTAGTPGNIEFSLSDETSTKTASVPASGSGLQIAVGTYDGTDMLAYTGSTAGSAVSTLDPNPDFGKSTPALTPGYVNGSLAGSRFYLGDGSQPDNVTVPGVGFKQIYPLLGSGAVHCHVLRKYGLADDMKFIETNAKVKIQCVIILEGAINSTKIASIISELQSTANW